MAYIEAERFAELKARVKAECLRRCHTGSVAEYGGEKYEYTNSPTEDHTVDVEHYEKLALPLSKIHSEKVPSLDGRRIVFDEDITEFEAALTLFERPARALATLAALATARAAAKRRAPENVKAPARAAEAAARTPAKAPALAAVTAVAATAQAAVPVPATVAAPDAPVAALAAAPAVVPVAANRPAR